DRHDLAPLQERIGDRDRLIEQSAGIIAQVDDETLQLVSGLGGEVGDRLLQVLGGLLVERRQKPGRRTVNTEPLPGSLATVTWNKTNLPLRVLVVEIIPKDWTAPAMIAPKSQ